MHLHVHALTRRHEVHFMRIACVCVYVCISRSICTYKYIITRIKYVYNSLTRTQQHMGEIVNALCGVSLEEDALSHSICDVYRGYPTYPPVFLAKK